MEIKPGYVEKIKQLKGPIFVIGASGFIGANLFDFIFNIRKDCFALTHEATLAWRLKLLKVPYKNILHCDIISSSSVKNVFEIYKPRTVFNLAAYGAYSKQKNPTLIFETNVLGTLHVLENCIGVEAYVHAGTSSEYGTNSSAPVETEKTNPNSHYAVSKVSAANLVEYYSNFNKIKSINLRLYSVYGPWEEPDRLVPRLIENARKGKLPPFVSPEICRDFIFVNDVVEAFVDAALAENNIPDGNSINIASGIKTTIGDMARIAKDMFNIEEEPQWNSMDNRQWDIGNWFGNPSRANKYLGWKATTDLKTGLAKTFDWQENIQYENTILPAFENPLKNPLISVVIACYMDGKAIPIMYSRLVKMFNDIKLRYEIIFVNDCSPDNSEEILDGICRDDSNVISITHSRNFGSQSAFLSGMEVSSGDVVVLMDGDLQDPPELIPEFYKKWLTGFEVVYGKRVRRETSLMLNIFYKVFYRLFRKLSYINIPVDAGDFSMMDRKVVKELIALPETEQFLRGLRAWVGFKQTGVNYVRPERMFGKSTNNWRKNFWWAKKAIFSFSFVPLEMMTYLGFILTGISFLALIFQIVARFIFPDIPHGITTIIVLVLFFGGIQLLAISFIGEYISKVFEETKKRPKFIRKKIQKGKKILIP